MPLSVALIVNLNNKNDHITKEMIDKFMNQIDNVNYETPFMFACKANHDKTIETFVNVCKVDIGIKNKCGQCGSQLLSMGMAHNESNKQFKNFLN